MSNPRDVVADAAHLWVGWDTALHIADHVGKKLGEAGYAIVSRDTLDKLRECYGDEFADALDESGVGQ